MDIKNLFETIDKFKQIKVLVIGDIIVDEYIWGKASRLSPEAPVPVLEARNSTYILGGAANVANNIVALGGQAFLSGCVGDDINANIVFDLAKESGVDTRAILKDANRPTTVKTRLIAHNHQQLARIDREVRTSIHLDMKNEFINKLSSLINEVDLVVLSDYAKGVLTPELISDVVTLSNKPIMVDPKGLDFEKYKGVNLITPNRNEAELATKSPQGASPFEMAKIISEITKAEHVLVTLGEDGVLYYSDGNSKTIPAVASEVYDVTGAGDSLISTLALSYPATGGDIEKSVILGNYAAGVAVRKTGTTTVTSAQLKQALESDLHTSQA
jgi:D-glycero-beta-D-manno-heptose-7-phosphate kinase